MSSCANVAHEANLQAEFYHQARLIGLPVSLEFHTPVGRLDVAILNKARDRLLAIVECKRFHWSLGGGNTPQLLRYKSIGVPVHGLSSFEACAALAKTLQALPGPGVAISNIATICEPAAEKRKADRIKRREAKFSEHLNVRRSGW